MSELCHLRASSNGVDRDNKHSNTIMQYAIIPVCADCEIEKVLFVLYKSKGLCKARCKR